MARNRRNPVDFRSQRAANPVPEKICCDVVNRGLAFYHDKVFPRHARRPAHRARCKKPVTPSGMCLPSINPRSYWPLLVAPRIAKGLVLIGKLWIGVRVFRGYVSAYDAETGKNWAWRPSPFRVIPRADSNPRRWKKPQKTWHGQWWVTGGGGTGLGFDCLRPPKLGFGLCRPPANGNCLVTAIFAVPGGGDNLYSRFPSLHSAPTDGEHRLALPGHSWRQLGTYDATQPLMLADLKIGGATRKVIMQASKNGFFLRSRSPKAGNSFSAKPFVHGITWASEIDL